MAEGTVSVAPVSNGGSSAGTIAIVLGIIAVVAAVGGGGYYFWNEKKKKEAAIAKAKEEEATANLQALAAKEAEPKVPLKQNGKPVLDKEGKPILVPVSSLSANKPVIGEDGKEILDDKGKKITPSSLDVIEANAISSNQKAINASIEYARPAEDSPYVLGIEADKRKAQTDAKEYKQASPDQNAFISKVIELFDLAPTICIGKKCKKVKDFKDYEKVHVTFKGKRKKAEKEYNEKLAETEKYVRGYLKGMNLALTPDNVGNWIGELKSWMNNTAKVSESSIDTVGQFCGKMACGAVPAVSTNRGKIGKNSQMRGATDRAGENQQ